MLLCAVIIIAAQATSSELTDAKKATSTFLFSPAVLDVRSGYPLCINCHKYQIIACLMFATSSVPFGQLLLLLEGPTADYGIQGLSMPDRV